MTNSVILGVKDHNFMYPPDHSTTICYNYTQQKKLNFLVIGNVTFLVLNGWNYTIFSPSFDHVIGFYNNRQVTDLLKECAKMKEFDHPNVLSLKGVCLDGGPMPYIIMPFMTNGSLLYYLKENRESLVMDTSSTHHKDKMVR